ncbi:MAG: hypothetical protein AB1644_01695 [Candidatus Zixiibacteriota bacterium]
MGLQPDSIAQAAAFQGRIIDSIIIDNRNVYDTAIPRYNNFLFRTANKLRVRTRLGMIRRELLFKVGDEYSHELVEETARNLRLRYALYDAWIEAFETDSGHAVLRVTTIDQWSLRGGFRIKRDANVTDYHFGLEELNFLGYNQFVSVYRYVPGNRDSYWSTAFRDSRLMGAPVRLDLAYTNNPLDDRRSIGVSRPFYNLSQRFSTFATVGSTKGRRDQYRDTVRIAESGYSGQKVDFGAEYRFGRYDEKIGLGGSYRYVYESNSNPVILSPVDSGRVTTSRDSVYHELGLSVSFVHPVFITALRINGFDYTEDFTLGADITLGYARALRPGFDQAVYDRYSFQSSFGFRRGASIVQLGYSPMFWVANGIDVRRTSTVSLRFYNNRISFLTFAFRCLYRSDWRRDGAMALVVDGENGLRGHDRFADTGDRATVVNFEARFFPGIDIMSAMVGGVLFADIARAWEPKEVWKLKGWHSAAGAGLRIAFKNITKTDLIRIDVIKPDEGPAELGFGTGQYF